jgi:PAS domain S-box-containing protein
MAASLNEPLPAAGPDRVNVLLVDDQPARLLSYRTILEPLDENLVEAASGEEALARLMETEFAVNLLDVNMPGMDGFETAKMIHEHPRFEKTPIIFVTAVNVSDMDRLKGYTLGAVDYVMVPVIPEILRSKVMVLIELFRKRRELQALNLSLAAANEALKSERAREVHQLNETLRRANADLAATNASLQAEIGERRRAEERMHFLADTIPSIVWTCDPDGRITYANREWDEYYGFPAGGSSPDHLTSIVLHPDEAEAVRELVAESLRAGEKFEFEARHRSHEGNYCWFMTRAVPWRAPTGELLSWFGITTSIHHHKQLMEQLREADRRKDQFLATLSHELRNPLAPIQSALNVHRLSPDGSGRQQLLGILERQMQLMVRLIDDLLDVSRINGGKLNLRKQRVPLSQVLSAALETARPLIEHAGHRLELDIEPGDLWLDADPQRLAQVFSNLLNNASKYTEPGGTLWVTLRRDGDEARVAVRDSGIGLSPEQLAEVFDLFVQVDASLERTRGGLGIGLTLVRQLVEMHGGRVLARSEGLGQGSEFEVVLPLASAPPSERVRDLGGTGSGAVTPSLRVLVVDDNQDGADMLALSLSILGHEVLTLYDPLEVEAAAERFRPMLAFLDVGMPRLNGYDLAARLRARPWGRDMHLVALTGWGQDNDRRRSAASGFDEHLVKPIDLETIVAMCNLAHARTGAVPTPALTDDAARD